MNQIVKTCAASLVAGMVVFQGADAVAQQTSGTAGTLKSASSTDVSVKSSSTETPDGDRLTPSELEDLVGAIALYPDPLLANVLAASVYPTEVAEAAKFVAGGGKPDQIAAKSWEPAVKAVANVPDAIKMMGQYGDWTVALGQAYLNQAKDVMDVVQSLRKKAQANGALATTPQQTVVVEQETVVIKPADPEVIYVPSYSPSVVYVDNDNDDEVVAGVVGFGVGIATGLILANNLDCNWHGGCVGYGWGGGGGYHGGNNDININGDVNIGNRNSNISGNGNSIGNRASAGNRVGNEGNAFAPNRTKNLASSQSNRTNQFKSGNTTASRGQVPGGSRASEAKSRSGGAARTSSANAAGRSNSASPARSNSRTPSADASARPSAGSGSSRVPAARPSTSSQSAYSGGSGTRDASNRGAASRSGSSSSGSRATPSRSSSGSGSRSSGARSGGGGRRR